MIFSYSALGAANNLPTRHELQFARLAEWLRTDFFEPRGPGPKDGPWICFADFGEHDPAIEGSGVRSYANLQGSHAVPLDLDLGAYVWTAADITARFPGRAFMAWTSYSHHPDRPRWRIVVPTARPMHRGEHYAVWDQLAALFAGDCGESSKDATRLNYLPGACLHPEHAQFIFQDGEPWPVPEGTPAYVDTAADGLTDEPIQGWNGPTDDDTLLTYMLNNRRSAEDAFGTTTRFQALWSADVPYLSAKFPHHEQPFDHTRADAALANELAFYTGSHGARCLELFMRSALAQRERFREDKARRAIALACQRDPEQHAFLRPLPVTGQTTPTAAAGPAGTADLSPASAASPATADATANPGAGVPSSASVPSANDFLAYLPQHDYIHRPTGLHWPAASLDGTIGKDARMALDLTHPVHLISWAPGFPERFRWGELDTTDHTQIESWTYNRYRAPKRPARSCSQIDPWLKLLHRLYPNDGDHILRYFADAVQNPGRKCNHALVLGSGVHGIGKDTLLKPLRWAVGERNYAIISPGEIFRDNNGWVASVVVQVSESRNVGDGQGERISKYDMYERTKDLAAAPPATLSCVDKWVARHQVRNCLRLIVTTNHGVDGIYLPAEDRRHYCAWSDAEAMSEANALDLHKWLDAGGCEEVAAFLYDPSHLDGWNPGARPPQTAWWWRLVREAEGEENPLAEAIERLGSPPWFHVEQLAKVSPAVTSWLADSRNRKNQARVIAALGYRRIENPGERRGRFSFGSVATIVYGKPEVTAAHILAGR